METRCYCCLCRQGQASREGWAAACSEGRSSIPLPWPSVWSGLPFPFPLTSIKPSDWDTLCYLPSYCFPCSRGLQSSMDSKSAVKGKDTFIPPLHLGSRTSAFPFVPGTNDRLKKKIPTVLHERYQKTF